MGLPSINITFAQAAATASRRSGQGVVAIILKDSTVTGFHEIAQVSAIPSGLSADNTEYVERAFTGYVNVPSKVLIYCLTADATVLAAALTALETKTFDYLVAPPDADAADSLEVATWIAEQRTDHDAVFKAVLPNYVADDEAIINFTGAGIKVGTDTFTSAEYCSRIAGMLAGTPLTISSTFAPLPEVSAVTRLTKTELDDAIDDGELVLFHDGVKVKIGRGVTSLTTTTTKSAQLKKIKIVEALDLIRTDLKILAQDTYIGKFPNSYDNKCLLITAIKAYLIGLESDGILQAGTSTVGIDIDAQRAYLTAQGVVGVPAMTDQQVKDYDTDDKVYLTASIRIMDAIEDITLDIAY